MKKYSLLILSTFLFGSLSAVQAFPMFQNEIVSRSNRPINCAYCHSHPGGPEAHISNELDKVYSRNEERYLKNRDHLAFDPTQPYDKNDILNDFGNYVEDIADHQTINGAMFDFDNFLTRFEDLDFDQDGISDADEMRDGTLPNDDLDGLPWKLFFNRIIDHCGSILFWVVSLLILSLCFFMYSNEHE